MKQFALWILVLIACIALYGRFSKHSTKSAKAEVVKIEVVKIDHPYAELIQQGAEPCVKTTSGDDDVTIQVLVDLDGIKPVYTMVKKEKQFVYEAKGPVPVILVNRQNSHGRSYPELVIKKIGNKTIGWIEAFNDAPVFRVVIRQPLQDDWSTKYMRNIMSELDGILVTGGFEWTTKKVQRYGNDREFSFLIGFPNKIWVGDSDGIWMSTKEFTEQRNGVAYLQCAKERLGETRESADTASYIACTRIPYKPLYIGHGYVAWVDQYCHNYSFTKPFETNRDKVPKVSIDHEKVLLTTDLQGRIPIKLHGTDRMEEMVALIHHNFPDGELIYDSDGHPEALKIPVR